MKERYYDELKRNYPTIQAVCQEIITLQSILHLPKGTEHYISDLHGEYYIFKHLMNNCSGVIREKVEILFHPKLNDNQINELCFMIYYPEQFKKQLQHIELNHRTNILRLIQVVRLVTSKYSRQAVRNHIHAHYAQIIDELIHAQIDEDNQQYVYHLRIIDTIIELEEHWFFIEQLTCIIKYFAIERLHVLGDIYDRGKEANRIMDDLIKFKRVDITWGNHDMVMMGAYMGNAACIMTVLKNSFHYNFSNMLESVYGISLRKLLLLAVANYPLLGMNQAMEKQCMELLFVLEKQLIIKYPEWDMKYRVQDDIKNRLTQKQQEVLDDLMNSFTNSQKLKEHMNFLFTEGSFYLRTSNNLLFHGCIPLYEDGSLMSYRCFGKVLKGKEYFDEINSRIKSLITTKNREVIDYMWYLWCSKDSPLCGRKIIHGHSTEEKNAYYRYIESPHVCVRLLKEFHLTSPYSMIICGHTPVKQKDGEKPIKSEGKVAFIDGGFCRQNQQKTGISGYTLISNSHGVRIKSHEINPLYEYTMDCDSTSVSSIIYTRKHQQLIKDSKQGDKIHDKMSDLKELLMFYRRQSTIN